MRFGAEAILMFSGVFLPHPWANCITREQETIPWWHFRLHVQSFHASLDGRFYVPSFERRGLRELCSRASSATCVLVAKRSKSLQMEVSSGCDNLPTMRLNRARP